ncbi:MAG TPA: DUF1801 domain-containing protein [Chitinophagaceae bacterium]
MAARQSIQKELKTSVRFSTIDEYHEFFPAEVRSILDQLRQAIRLAAPRAFEVISYNMPTFKQHGNLVHYAAYKKHIGFYPTSSPIKVISAELINYKTSKGAIRFPINEPLPLSLIRRIVRLRVAEDTARANLRKSKHQ